jgi:dihydroflavonol-4-reductase
VNQGKCGKVLVTGATGFVAGHCVVDLLARGYDVRGTIRNLKTADLTHLRPAIDGASGTFELAVATLDADEGWAEAVRGCDYVLHVASPIPFKAPSGRGQSPKRDTASTVRGGQLAGSMATGGSTPA